jgi:hypothetical protein
MEGVAMSVDALIAQYGKSVTVVRPSLTKDATGGPSLSSNGTSAATMFLQVLGGGTSRHYGGERAQYDATGYIEIGVDVKDADMITYVDASGGTRTYRVENVRTPDEREDSQGLAYQIVSLQEDRPRT